MIERECPPGIAAAMDRIAQTGHLFPLRVEARKAYPWGLPVDKNGEYDPTERLFQEDELDRVEDAEREAAWG